MTMRKAVDAAIAAGARTDWGKFEGPPVCPHCGKRHFTNPNGFCPYAQKGWCQRCKQREAVRYDKRARRDPKGTEHGMFCDDCLWEIGLSDFEESTGVLARELAETSTGMVPRSFPSMQSDEGILERRPLTSSRDHTHIYSMARTASGWQHEDQGCESWLIRSRCRHADELNKESAMETSIIPRDANALRLIEELDDAAIVKAISGQITSAWVYSFKPTSNAATVVGLSVDGVEEAARELAKHGEAIREMDVRCEYEDEYEARFVARAGRYAVDGEGHEVLLDVAIRAKRQPKYHDRDHKSPNQYWYETGIAKAVRNAKEALLSEAVKSEIIAKAAKAGRTVNVQASAPPQQSEAVQAPPRPTPPKPNEPRPEPSRGQVPLEPPVSDNEKSAGQWWLRIHDAQIDRDEVLKVSSEKYGREPIDLSAEEREELYAVLVTK